MKARCIQECYDGKKCWKYTPEGGENKDGIYDIDPLSPIAQYFEFPEGTEKYKKIITGNKKEGFKTVETTEIVGGKKPEKKEDKKQEK